MSEYTFKNLSEIDNVAEPADGTTVMGFENGTPIQMPMSAIKGSGGVFVIDPDDPEFNTADAAYGDKIKEALLSGKQVWRFLDNRWYTPAIAFGGTYTTSGATFMGVVFAAEYDDTDREFRLNTNLTPLRVRITG